MDRGAALNCRVVHNWNENASTKVDETEKETSEVSDEQKDTK
jgi:hypothetical protein